MRFAHPEWLALLWIISVLWAGLRWARLRRQKIHGRFMTMDLADKGLSSLDRRRRRWQEFFLIAALAFSFLALARPQWGYEMREIKRQGLDILIVMDTSRSMLTADVKPNRLERAKLAVKDVIKKLQGDRIGLIAFAGDAFLLCPLTVDYNGFLLSLDDLSTESVPRGGTHIGRAIEEAMRGYDNTPSQYKAVVIMTDGENLEEDPMPAVEQAKKKGIKIYTIGIGTTGGELVKVEDMLGKDSFLKDSDGNFVKSRLNAKLLEDIAVKTGGVYVQSAGAVLGLDLIYERDLAKLEKRDITTQKARQYYERFQLPLGLAMIFFGVATFLPERKKDDGRL